MSVALTVCNGGPPQGCDPFDCADVTVDQGANGASYDLKPGQSVLIRIPSTSGSGLSARSTNERVAKLGAGPSLVGDSAVASFVAISPGAAAVTLALGGCSESSTRGCSVTVSTVVSQLPSTRRQLSVEDSGKSVALRPGDRVLVTLPALTVGSWVVTISPESIIGWSFSPKVFPHGSYQGVLTAHTPGTATFDAVQDACLATNSACVHEVAFRFVVGSL